MSNNQNSNRLRRAKSELTHSRSSVSNLKSEFRSRFFNRLRISRSRSVDRFRRIVEDYGDIHYKSVSDLRKALSEDQEAANLMTDEVNDILNQIENELTLLFIQSEAEKHLNEGQVETDDIVNRHLACVICNNVCEKNNICGKCSGLFHSEF